MKNSVSPAICEEMTVLVAGKEDCFDVTEVLLMSPRTSWPHTSGSKVRDAREPSFLSRTPFGHLKNTFCESVHFGQEMWNTFVGHTPSI